MAEGIFEQTIKEATGHSVEQIQQTPLDELRRDVEKKRGRLLKFVSSFPWVGRGNVMRDRLVSHEEAETAYDDAIRRLGRSLRKPH
jgi:hypothetical protein